MTRQGIDKGLLRGCAPLAEVLWISGLRYHRYNLSHLETLAHTLVMAWPDWQSQASTADSKQKRCAPWGYWQRWGRQPSLHALNETPLMNSMAQRS